MNHPDHDGRPNVSALRRAAPWIAGGFLALMVLIVRGAVGSIAWYGFGMFNDQAKAAAGSVTPTPAMRPTGNCADQHQNQDDQQYGS